MSTSWLYHAFRIRGYRHVDARYVYGQIVIRIDPPRESLWCPCCGSAHVHVIERFRRWWRTLPIGSKGVWIEMDSPRVECQSCRARRRVEVAFAESTRRHTGKGLRAGGNAPYGLGNDGNGGLKFCDLIEALRQLGARVDMQWKSEPNRGRWQHRLLRGRLRLGRKTGDVPQVNLDSSAEREIPPVEVARARHVFGRTA
jgi:hypothetical protein